MKGLRYLFQLIEVVKNLYDCFVPELGPIDSAFLVGASFSKQTSFRYLLGQEFKKIPSFKVYYPEQMFTEMLYEGHLDFLELENILAAGVDAVIVCPESPGSIAELGAFSNHQKLKNKLIVVQNKYYKKQKSFINLGPLRYLKKQKPSKVIWHDYSKNDKIEIFKLAKRIRHYVKEIGNDRDKVGLHNITIMEQFLLAIFFIFGTIPTDKVQTLLKSIEEHAKEGEFVILGCALINYHIRRGNLQKYPLGYDITPKGKELLFQSLGKKFNHRSLDKFRIEALTLLLRKGAKFEEQVINS